MTLRLEVGKFYRTRDGRKIGPMRDGGAAYSGLFVGPGTVIIRTDGSPTTHPQIYLLDGTVAMMRAGEENDILVAEWTESSPVRTTERTITETEIVPGIYGRLEIAPYSVDHDGWAIGITTSNGRANSVQTMSAEELRAAAVTLNELADALDRIAAEKKGTTDK
jgi:hypothetical protein